MLRIQVRIRIRIFLGLPDPDPLVQDTSLSKNVRKTLIPTDLCDFFMTFNFEKNDVNVGSKINKQKT